MGEEIRDKRARFVEEYLVDYNSKHAAIRAGYSPKTAAVIGSQLLTKPEVQAELTKRQRKISSKLNVTASRVLEELGRIAFADVGELFDDDGNIKPVRKLPVAVRAALASIEVTTKKGMTKKNGQQKTTKTYRVKQLDKTAALNLLAKHLGMFREEAAKLDVSITIEGRDADCG